MIMSMRKKFYFITAFILIAAVVIVICVESFTGKKTEEYDGTLVERNTDNSSIILLDMEDGGYYG